MWLLISFISMVLCAFSEIVGKRSVSMKQDYSILKLRISAILIDAILLPLLCIFYYRGTGTNPWLIAIENPLVILNSSLNVLDILFFLLSLKYIGLTIQEAYYGTTNILFFIGMIFINLVFGKVGDVKKILIPSKLVIIFVLLAASFILPRLTDSNKNETKEILKLKKKNIILGLLFALVGYILDATESLISMYVFAESDITAIDYMAAGYAVAVFWGLIFYELLSIRTKLYVSGRGRNSPAVLPVDQAGFLRTSLRKASSSSAVGTFTMPT